MRLNYICWLPSGFTILYEEDDITVGKVHVVIDKNIAKIADIIVIQKTVPRYRYLPFFKQELTYRNKGYGTHLLQATIDKCRKIGITKIVGRIVGDTEKLQHWYSINGFVVHNGQISMMLDENI